MLKKIVKDIDQDLLSMAHYSAPVAAQVFYTTIKHVVRRLAMYRYYGGEKQERIVKYAASAWAHSMIEWKNEEIFMTIDERGKVYQPRFLGYLLELFSDKRLDHFTFRWFNLQSLVNLRK